MFENPIIISRPMALTLGRLSVILVMVHAGSCSCASVSIKTCVVAADVASVDMQR